MNPRILVALLPLCVACKSSETKDPRDSSVTIWSGEVELLEEHVVEAGQTLEVQPGTTVSVGEGVHLVVRGELRAVSDDAPIVFTAASDGLWGGVVFEDSSVDATFENLDDYASGSILDGVWLERAERAVVLQGASPYLVGNVFQDNESPGNFEQEGGPALFIDAGSHPRVRDNLFQRNLANPFGFGGAVFVRDSDPILQDNAFLANESSYGGALYTELMAAPIVGNLFQDNETLSEGGAASLLSSINAFVNNTVIGNHSEGDGGGLHVCVTCYPHATPFVLDNVVRDNTCADPRDEAAAGVGAAYLKVFAHNVVEDNTDGDGHRADFGWWHELSEGYPTWVSHPSIAHNHWGTTDLAVVEDTVHDGTDAAELGVVGLAPVLSRAPSPETRVTITSRKLRYYDAGTEMPVFLTLYNPGPERVVTLTITRTDNGVSEAFSGALDFPGAAREGDGWSLVLPQNSAFFQQILTETYRDQPDGEGSWEATLTDERGEVVGIPSVSPYAYGE